MKTMAMTRNFGTKCTGKIEINEPAILFVILILHQLCTVQLKVVSRSIEHVLGARVNKRLDFFSVPKRFDAGSYLLLGF